MEGTPSGGRANAPKPPLDLGPAPVPAPTPANPFDAHPPHKITDLVATVGVRKATMPALQILTLGVLAGAYIAFGGMFFTLVMTGNTLGFGPGRLLGGAAFSLGLILVVVAGAELFTGNTLIVMAWADCKVTTAQLLWNWTLVLFANLVGSVGAALIMHWSGALTIGDGAMSATAIRIAEVKTAIDPVQAFWRGVLCNALVCLAVWLCYAARSVADRIVAILFPVSAFVALGFEHSIANMYLIAIGWLAGGQVMLGGALSNLIPVTLGNAVGGGVFVALVYWIIYRYRRQG